MTPLYPFKFKPPNPAPPSSEKYEKTLEDELDLTLIDQLSDTVSQISNFCFELKKFCITTELLTLTFLAKFTSNEPALSLFFAGAAIPICFWFLDSVAYFYQVRLRGKMESTLVTLKTRNSVKNKALNNISFIDETRLKGSSIHMVYSAAFNHSMWTYVFLIGADFLIWIVYQLGDLK